MKRVDLETQVELIEALQELGAESFFVDRKEPKFPVVHSLWPRVAYIAIPTVCVALALFAILRVLTLAPKPDPVIAKKDKPDEAIIENTDLSKGNPVNALPTITRENVAPLLSAVWRRDDKQNSDLVFSLIDRRSVVDVSCHSATFTDKIDDNSRVSVQASDAVLFEKKTDGASYWKIGGKSASISHPGEINGRSVVAIDAPSAIVNLGKVDGKAKVVLYNAKSVRIEELAGESDVYISASCGPVEVAVCHWGGRLLYVSAPPTKLDGDGYVQKVAAFPADVESHKN